MAPTAEQYPHPLGYLSRWRINFQPDSPDTLPIPSRPDVRRLRSFSKRLDTKDQQASLPVALWDHLAKLVSAAAAVSVHTHVLDESVSRRGAMAAVAGDSVMMSSPLASSALHAVQERLKAARCGVPVRAPADALMQLVVVDPVLRQLLPERSMLTVAGKLRGCSDLLSVSDFAQLLIGVKFRVDDATADDCLRSARQLIERRFKSDMSSALVVARSFAKSKSCADAALAPDEWFAFLASLGWQHGQSEALQAFLMVDFREQGLVPASELLCDEACFCRQWLHESLGHPADMLDQMSKQNLHRTARQRRTGAFNAAQWVGFLVQHGWTANRNSAVVFFKLLDVDSDGEVRGAELVGLVDSP